MEIMKGEQSHLFHLSDYPVVERYFKDQSWPLDHIEKIENRSLARARLSREDFLRMAVSLGMESNAHDPVAEQKVWRVVM